jgi:hypothetical protein
MSNELSNKPLTFDRPVHLQVACENMRHKLMYVDSRHAQRGMIDSNSDTRVYWCTRTMEVLGPDNEPVSPRDCHTGRPCYCGH